ncbi:MAG: LptA/OstA family protein [Candidatus Avelusimicrobium sp.]|uniref:LptA/OstA family protein n=1 Tax=Candidatus Avelusimicrobium sp. TaxID=3048833 RepID=UPI003F0A08A6
MKKTVFFSSLLVLSVFLNGCKTIRADGPQIPVPAAKPRVDEAKNNLKNKRKAAAEIPPVLGGVVQSDSWVIYKDKQQEEFTGNVSYDNGSYVFRADYALSERAINRFSARGRVYLRQNEPDGSFYEAYADNARYNYKTQKGVLTANADKTVKLIYSDAKKQTVTATAKHASFDLNQKIFILQDTVRVERSTPAGTEILTAQKATYKQAENYAILEGGAQATDGARTLEAETIVYDGNKNASYAYGARPIVYGKTEQGTFAVIADKVSSDNAANTVSLDGKVQGWIVSPQLNDADVNSKF